MIQRPLLAALAVLAPLALATPSCKSKAPPAQPATSIDASAPPPAATAARAPAPLALPPGPPGASPSSAPKAKGASWPLWKYGTLGPGRVARLAGARVSELAVDPRGEFAIVLALRGARSELAVWDGGTALRSLTSPALANRELTGIALSPFTRALYVVSGAGSQWRIDRFDAPSPGGGTLGGAQNVYQAPARIASLHIPFVLFGGHERLFFGQQHAQPSAFQILSTRTDGSARYEVTSPTGALGVLTDADFRSRVKAIDPDKLETEVAPSVVKAATALPWSMRPHDGALLGSMEGDLFVLPYGVNWGAPMKVAAAGPGARLVASPNGRFVLRFVPGKPGVEILDPNNAVVETLARDRIFVVAPAFSPSGRTIVVALSEGDGTRIEAMPVDTPLAAVRYLHEVKPSPEATAALAKNGMTVQRTHHPWLHYTYERLRYDECHAHVEVPIFAALDGFLEVLHAGFQAVFMLGEEKLSRPRLQAFLEKLGAAAQQAGKTRVAQIADVAKKLLAGDASHAEAKLVLAEKLAKSALHTVPAPYEIDFQDFHPRGPYTATDALMNYFRAFKYTNLLRLDAEEASALRESPEVVAAWKAWVETQAPYLSGSRQPTIFGGDTGAPPHVRKDCIPARVRGAALAFPLSWGIDSEILESTVMREGVPADCSVSGRMTPSGLDLLAGLGSTEARSLLAPEEKKFAGLSKAYDALTVRFRSVPERNLVQTWLAIVQRLATQAYVPEGVSPTQWRRRLLQTALATWTSFKHTTVLVNATSGAECGVSFSGFERREPEPVRGAVDPLPDAWQRTSLLLRTLSEHAQRLVPDRRFGAILRDASAKAAAFGSMATRQMKGEVLTEAEYESIQRFAGEIEHPFLLLKSAIARKEEGHGEMGGGTVVPPRMAKIVDVHSSPAGHLHMAVGNPLATTVLLGDRGILTPASGAVYSYYEVVAAQRLDDDQWRKQLNAGTPSPPSWAPLASSPPKQAAAE